MDKGIDLLELFTSPTCPYCSHAKRIVENLVNKRENILLIERDLTNTENVALARKYNIRGVPTLLVNRKYKFHGIPDPVKLMRVLRNTNIYRR